MLKSGVLWLVAKRDGEPKKSVDELVGVIVDVKVVEIWKDTYFEWNVFRNF